MTNHYHIVVETIEGNLSQGMRHLNGVYTQYFNHRHHQVGHVYQGRYKGILVDKDSYLLELTRYVVLNPVRAHMVSHENDWVWSSYRCMTGTQCVPDWLETDCLLRQFSVKKDRAISLYKDYVRKGVGQPGIWVDLKQQVYLGDEHFLKEMQKAMDSQTDLSEIPWAQRRPPAKSLQYYKENYRDREQGMVVAYQTGDYTMKAIASFFNVHYSTVSRAIKKAGSENA